MDADGLWKAVDGFEAPGMNAPAHRFPKPLKTGKRTPVSTASTGRAPKSVPERRLPTA
jgi:hypothetical protein